MLKKHLIKYRLIDQHMKLVSGGHFDAARMILRLLRKGVVVVGLGDVDHEVETIAEDCGCRVRYGRNYNTATIRY